MTTTRNKIGKRYGGLVVVSADKATSAGPVWLTAKCDCGGEIRVPARYIVGGRVTHCGCGVKPKPTSGLSPRRAPIVVRPQNQGRSSKRTLGVIAAGNLSQCREAVGKKFTRMSVVAASELEPGSVHCLCECGKSWYGRFHQIVRGVVRSCGCLNRDVTIARSTKHGQHKTAEYETWRGMVRRCTRPNFGRFKSYGGRGIRVCDRWLTGDGERSGLECFMADMGPRPGPGWSIHRVDNDGNYEPSNCVWATRSEQASVQRPGYRFGDPLRVLSESKAVNDLIERGQLI